MKDFHQSKLLVMLRVLFLLLCIIGISFAWFNQIPYEGHAIEFRKSMQLASAGGNVKNYIGTVIDASGTHIQYTELKNDIKVTWVDQGKAIEEATTELGGFVADNLYPGVKIYFMTEIENDKDIELLTSIYLTGIEYSAALNPAIHFVEVQPAAFNNCYANDAKEFTNEKGELLCRLSSARVSDSFVVPAAHGEGETRVNGKATVFWYIEISGEDAGNECRNAWISINQMQLISGS